MFTVFISTKYPNRSTKFEVGYTKFSAGEVNVRLPDEACALLQDKDITVVEIYARLNSSDDVIALMLLADAIAHFNRGVRKTVFIPYMPYGRQDRVCNPGEAAAASVFARLLNFALFDRIITLDPHNTDKFSAETFNSDPIPQVDILDTYFSLLSIMSWQQHIQADYVRSAKSIHGVAPPPAWNPTEAERLADYVVVAPDKGACKKAQAVADKLFGGKCIFANKVRDPATMEITNTEILPATDGQDIQIEGKHLFVVDDICDGGRTFIELAKELKKHNPASLTLYVTHAIFSRGVAPIKEHYDVIIHTDSMRDAAMYTDETICFSLFKHLQTQSLTATAA